MSCEVIITPSGAPAMRDRASGEIMHPGTGAVVEPSALYVVPSRLEARLMSEERGAALVLLDVGLGAGSNAIAAWRLSESLPEAARRLEIVSFDNDLSPLALALRPEHAEGFGLSKGAPNTHAAATALLEEGRYETARTVWRLELGDFRESIGHQPTASADIVFWDLYSSKTIPSLWTVASFSEVRRVCRAGATMHTFSSATSVRSALLLAGFAVGVGGRTGDRAETTIAATRSEDLAEPLDARWLTRLSRSTAAFPRDIPSDDEARAQALARVRAQPQFSALLSITALALAGLASACASAGHGTAGAAERPAALSSVAPIPKSATSAAAIEPVPAAEAAPSPAPIVPLPPPPESKRPPPIPITNGTRVLMFGDSMVWSGLGTQLKEHVVARGGTLVQTSKPNATTMTWSEGRELQNVLTRFRPDVVIIALTSNELFVPNPRARIPEIRRIVERIGSRACVWVGPSPWLPEKGILGVVREHASPCRYFDSTSLVLERQSDGIHPTLQGGKTWADAVWREVFAE